MAGLIQTSQRFSQEAQSGFASLADMEQRRNREEDALKQRNKQNKRTSISSGAGTGAAVGSAWGPWGTVIGAGVGAIAGWAGYELF